MLESQFLGDEAATVAAAQGLAPFLKTGDVILLNGFLGAGKSTFARALIRALPGVGGQSHDNETVPSPTYTLVQTYDRAIGSVGHFDLYRLGDPEEIWELGLEEMIDGGLAIIEWAEKLGPLTPRQALHIHLTDHGTGRYLEVRDQRNH